MTAIVHGIKPITVNDTVIDEIVGIEWGGGDGWMRWYHRSRYAVLANAAVGDRFELDYAAFEPDRNTR